MKQCEVTEQDLIRQREVSLLDLLDRVLDTGVLADGQIYLGVADINLIHIALKCLICDVETIQRCQKGPTSATSGKTISPLCNDTSKPSTSPNPSLQRRGTLPPLCKGRIGGVEGCGDTSKPSTSPTPSYKGGEKAVSKQQGTFFPDTKVSTPSRKYKINIEPKKVEKGLVKLVLTLVDLLRQLMERRAIRRMEGGSLDEKKIEALGTAFLRMAEKMEELKKYWGLTDEDLNLDLGPLGKLK